MVAESRKAAKYGIITDMTLGEFDSLIATHGSGDFTSFIEDNIFSQTPVVFGGDMRAYNAFRQRMATTFHVSKDDIYIVGSARLGFSYRKQTEFSLESDIDVAIVNERLFDEYSKKLCRYNHDVIRRVVALDGVEWSRYLGFLKYFAAGWLRPDKGTMIMRKNPDSSNWWRYFKSISYGRSEVGNHKVNAGIYKSKYYLCEYLKISLEDRYNSIRAEI